MTVLQARRYQPLDADLTAVAASGLAGPWTAYTPTVTAASGTFTTLGTIAGRYLIMGKVTFVQMTINITTNGTAATYVNATLPNTGTDLYFLTGREPLISGKMLVGSVQGGTTSVRILNYDATYPGASGASIRLSGCYENN